MGFTSKLQDGADGHNFERGPPKDHLVSEEKIFFLISSPLFSNLHNRSKWVMGFTSKLQGRYM